MARGRSATARSAYVWTKSKAADGGPRRRVVEAHRAEARSHGFRFGSLQALLALLCAASSPPGWVGCHRTFVRATRVRRTLERRTAMTSPSLPIFEFVLRNYKNFNSRATRDALLAYVRHIDAGGKMLWAVAGAMSSAQLGITLAPAIRAGLVHGLAVTGANLQEPQVRLVANHSYRDLPDYRYFTKHDDTKILADRMRRVTDTSIPEDEAFRAVEKFIVPMWKSATDKGQRRFWHEYFYELIQTIGADLYE